MINENPIAAPVEEIEHVDQDNRVWSAFYLTIYALLIAVTISVVALGW
jgi:hypothetical protein